MATLLEIMALAARLAREGSSGTVGADSTTSQLRDPALRNTGLQSDHLAGAWILTPDQAAATDYQRQTTQRPFAPEVGGLTVTRPWAVAPAADDTYYLFNRVPALQDPSHPISWQMAVNDLMGSEQLRDRVEADLIAGQTRRFTIDAIDGWVPTRRSVVRVFGRTDETNYVDYDGSKEGRWYSIHEDVVTGSPSIVIETSWEPGDHLLMVDLIRPRPSLSLLTDDADYPLNAAAYGTVWRLKELLGAPAEEVARWQRDWSVRYQQEQPSFRVET